MQKDLQNSKKSRIIQRNQLEKNRFELRGTTVTEVRVCLLCRVWSVWNWRLRFSPRHSQHLGLCVPTSWGGCKVEVSRGVGIWLVAAQRSYEAWYSCSCSDVWNMFRTKAQEVQRAHCAMRQPHAACMGFSFWLYKSLHRKVPRHCYLSQAILNHLIWQVPEPQHHLYLSWDIGLGQKLVCVKQFESGSRCSFQQRIECNWGMKPI